MAGVSTESLSKVEEVLEAHASLQPLNLASELFAVVDVLDQQRHPAPCCHRFFA